ncbi:MAG TPA: transporter substrate-binding domain-containing protein [Fusibacter sp.]|nr:transporter substrate-binding domain-containing protein [Fusibacter sp.]
MKAVLRSFIITALLIQFVFASIPAFAASATESLELTEDELVFINDHPIIHLAVDPQFYPYEFFDTDGIYKGIAADYLKLISERTGIKFVPTKGLTWTQAYEKAATGSLDMLGCVLKTSAREALFTYSKPYYNTYRVIYVSNDNTDIRSFDDLNGKRVAVQTNSSHHSYLEGFPEIELVQYQTVDEALAAVSDGREAAFVGNFATSSYIIKSEGITNLQFVNIEDQIQQGLHFAVRKDWPELVSILDKALANITSEEKIAINNTWIGVESKTNYEDIIRIALIVGAIVVLIFLVSTYWIVKLRKEILQRKQTEEALQIAKNEAEQANHIKSTFLARM